MAKMIAVSDEIAGALSEYAKREDVSEYVLACVGLEHYLVEFGDYRTTVRDGRIVIERRGKNE